MIFLSRLLFFLECEPNITVCDCRSYSHKKEEHRWEEEALRIAFFSPNPTMLTL